MYWKNCVCSTHIVLYECLMWYFDQRVQFLSITMVAYLNGDMTNMIFNAVWIKYLAEVVWQQNCIRMWCFATFIQLQHVQALYSSGLPSKNDILPMVFMENCLDSVLKKIELLIFTKAMFGLRRILKSSLDPYISNVSL